MNEYIAIVEDFSVVQIKGDERHKYLHGQLTVDTENWNESQARLSAHCDFKGKMWQQAYLLEFLNSFIFVGHKEGNEASIEQLKKYGVFAKVDITTADDLCVVAGSGTKAETSFKTLFSSLPTEHFHAIENEFGCIFKIDISTPRFIAILTHQGKAALDDLISNNYDESTLFEYSEVSDGLAYIRTETCNEYVPQMFNLQSLNAIDFDKGCYMGQEVVARTKFLGKNKRAIYLLEASEEFHNIDIAGVVEKQIGDNWRRGGNVIRSSVADGRTRILAVLANDTETGDVLRLKDTQSKFTVLPHPYNFQVES